MNLVIIIGCILVAMTVHEFMHAYTGHLLGDSTAHDEGRISLNPLKHVDPVMTVLLPAVAYAFFQVLIMAAKPVPFNPHRVKYGEYGAALIALAGPASNLVLAGVTALVLSGTGISGGLEYVLYTFMQLNVALFVFNIIPLPPLDGSRILYAFAPEPVQEFMNRIEPYGLIIIIVLVMVGGFGLILQNINQSILQFLL
ncbi:site-2 protease family protein [Candidatus Saccharibacteria bacterium]|nr:site-2 protease family protein [Candidatus Saccharibacteria bacterium]